MPPLFSERYPNELETFNKNIDKLITPMDIHSTLTDLIRMEMNLTKSKEASSSIKRSKSLFTEEILKTLEGHTSIVTSLAVLSDGSLASGSWDNTIRIWDTESGETIKILKGQSPVTRNEFQLD